MDRRLNFPLLEFSIQTKLVHAEGKERKKGRI